MKKLNAKGFTLAELLIVVAIIAVLVAVSIPVFTAQLEKSREETDIANLRSAYAIASTDALTGTYLSSDGTSANESSEYTASQVSTNGTYVAYYNIKTGKLTKTKGDDSKGKGTASEGGCDTYDGPIVYKTGTVANSGNIVVMITNKGGVADKVEVGFTKKGLSDVKLSSDFDC